MSDEDNPQPEKKKRRVVQPHRLQHLDKNAPPPMHPETQNIVSTARWKSQHKTLNLSVLADDLRGRFNPSAFPACIIPLRNPRVTVSIFRTCSVVVPGARHPYESVAAFHMLRLHVLKRVGFLVHILGYKTENVVGSASLGFFVDLDAMCAAYPLEAQLDRKMFAGLRFCVDKTKRFVVFESGRVVITGCISEEIVRQIFWEYVPMFVKFKKPSENKSRRGKPINEES